MTETPLLDVRGLTVEAGRAEAAPRILDDVSFSLQAKRILGVIGPGGSGKTTLAHALVNWLRPPLEVTSGEIRFRGEDILAMPSDRSARLRGKTIAYVGGDPQGAMNPTMHVGEQIVEKLRAVEPGVSYKEARERAVALLGAVRIPSPEQRFGEYPFQYSGGMMQRAMIVDALIANPELLIADSITQPLDVTVGAQILKLMRELSERFDTAILFISASLPTVADVADEILVLEGGRVAEFAAVDDVISRPRHAATRKLIDELPKLWQRDGMTTAAATDKAQTVLSVQNVSRVYPIKSKSGLGKPKLLQAVRDVSFDIHAGENFGVVGESGCGKSTLMRLLTALEKPDTGHIVFDGEDIFGRGRAGTRRFRREVQLVLQDPFGSLPPQSSIGEIISEPLVIHNEGDRRQRRARALDMMGEVGLDRSLYESLPTRLTAGQRQRVNVARAMILEPRLMIMDETLSALDQTEQSRLIDLFERLQAQHGFTYLFISHDIALVRRVCARIAVMYLGEVVELAANERLFFNPGHPYSKALLSAAPTLEDRRYRPEDCLLEGEPPSPIDLPPGCAFASRCPSAFDRCRKINPQPVYRGDHDRAACHLLQPEPVAS
ncbi:dipeptide ABC transporter ATP-binding protein [Oceaniradius stylonematis]|uniref:dipeptide ABC transporter ATP-binding protein n=1 Tax=Oceaniradius stylonematis TaxID=2184161 RepID=UPI000F3CB059|nr:MAG: ABC transporter ATP-binding protein [Oricola sp.]